tara:strand:+ start:4028 stop:4654 length:627 start_codon:yes stop_codon:yes gene_type:complete
MAKRFTDTTKWNEDWYLELSIENKLFWIYICDNSNHAGIFKPNKKMFELLIGSKIDINKFLEQVNQGKNRIIILGNGRWYLNKFIEFQYGQNLNPKNRVHKSILKLLNDNDINYEYINKELLEENITAHNSNTLSHPKTINEVVNYFKDKGSNKQEAERFFYYYESQGWKVGKNKMKNWKMSASGWVSRNNKGKVDPSYLDDQLKDMK